MKTGFFLSLFALAAFAGTDVSAQARQYEQNALYVRFKEISSPKLSGTGRFLATEKVAPLQKLQADYGLHRTMFCMRTLGQPILERTFELRFDSIAKIDRLIEELQNDSRIEFVERIPINYIQGMPARQTGKDGADDPLYQTEYGSWFLKLINAEAAWEKQTGSAEVKVAVVDNAVWGDHPDLGIAPEYQYNIASGVSGNSAPPSNVPQDPGCSNTVNCPSYYWSHGTHCAGAIGAVRNNGVGIASIGSGVTLMGVSCPGTDASGQEVRNGFAGVSWAAENGADVISISWGNYTIAETDRAIIQACIDKGIVVVAAAGNNGYKDNPMYPAYLPGVISVAAVNDNKQLSSFSNYGSWVTVAAPGGYVIKNNAESKICILSSTYCTSQNYRLNGYSEFNGMYYDGMYGTSMATPIVSGLCGLLLSANPGLSPYLMREVLMASAQALDKGNNKDICPGSGVIDAAAALLLQEKNVALPGSFDARRVNRQIELSWEAPQTNNEVSRYQIFLDNAFLTEVESSQLNFTHELTTNQETLYRFGVRALYANGDTSLRACADIFVPVLYNLEVAVQPEGCGTISGTGAYPLNQTVSLVAHATKGCTFTRWTEGSTVLGRDSVLDYTLAYNAEIRAIFSGSPDVANDVFAKASPIRIYPNPASSLIRIEGGETSFYAVSIYSVTGRCLLARNFAQGVKLQEIDTEFLRTGTYIVNVLTDNGWYTEKLTKL